MDLSGLGGKVALVAAGLVACGMALDLLARRSIRRGERNLVADEALPGRRFWVRGVGLHYLDQGEGLPVVLVHGFTGSTFSFRYTIPALAGEHRVIAVDLPGFGYSDRPPTFDYSQANWALLLREFLQRLGVTRAVFVGHSLGGGVVQRLAAASPELVAGLVLVGSVSAADTRRMPVGPGAGAVMRLGQAVLLSQPRVFRRVAAGSAFTTAFMTPEVLHGYERPLRVPGTAAAIRKVITDSRHDAPINLSAIDVPVLLLWGEGDRVVDRRVAMSLLAALPNARLEIVDHAAHLPLEEQPAASNALLLTFLRELQGRQAVPPANGAVSLPSSAGGTA